MALYLQGFGRFEERTKVNLDGKLIALVGPNEAGKSTILRALTRLDVKEPIPHVERTRATSPSDDAVALEAVWLVEGEDLAELDNPVGSELPRWLTVRKTFGASLATTITPALQRDYRPRRRVQKTLERARSSKWLRALDAEEGSEFELERVNELAEGLKSREPTLRPEVARQAEELAGMLASRIESAPRYAGNLPEELRALAEHEVAEHPNAVARDHLFRRTPDFLEFAATERELSSSYDLQVVADSPPRALANLAALAGLDLRRLRDAIANDERGIAVEIRDNANARLQARVNEAWGQSSVEPRLENDDFILRIFVRTGRGGYQDIAQRSDGLRAFLALLGFTTERSRGVPPILLIDEAEIHLHYDAQADLVTMLGKQRQASQVIYTTHSAGCLPQDLGTGVRLVVPGGGLDRSSVENWPWASGAGFDPLLLGMGASTLAFVPTRAALIGEGAGELILLPTMLREALDIDVLDFQVAPGSAEASRGAIARIDLQGTKVGWLVDGDSGGRDNRNHLVASGVPPERILTLGGPNSGLAIEDLLAPAIYADAVNEELRRSYGEAAPRISASELPSSGRPGYVTSRCEQEGASSPNKGAVAHRAAERRSEATLVAAEHIGLLHALYAEVLALFE